MGLVIRTLYNNQGWNAPCIKPYHDRNCFLCLQDNVNIRQPRTTDEVCGGHCWDQHICERYRWGCTKQGEVFGHRTYPGAKVFFVFKQPDNELYTLWGKSTVLDKDNEPWPEGRDDEKGFAFVYFEPFEPLARDKWVTDLSDLSLVEASWRIGRYRYIDERREQQLERLIERTASSDVSNEESMTVLPTPSSMNLGVRLSSMVVGKLDKIAAEEGREKDEIVREAIAEWLRGRET